MKSPRDNLLRLMYNLQIDVDEFRSMDPLASLSKLAEAKKEVRSDTKDPSSVAPNNCSVEHVSRYQRLTEYVEAVTELGTMADVNHAIAEVHRQQRRKSGLIFGCYTHMVCALEARKADLLNAEYPWITNSSNLGAYVDQGRASA